MSICQRIQEIIQHPDTKILKYPGHKVSSYPIHSKSYANCNGVAILNHSIVGLSHYDLFRGDPKVYMKDMINEILETSHINGLCAVLIGGDKKHFRINKKILREFAIPVIGSYCDGWRENEIVFNKKRPKKAPKDVVVIPRTQEVLMYSIPVHYVRLTPG